MHHIINQFILYVSESTDRSTMAQSLFSRHSAPRCSECSCLTMLLSNMKSHRSSAPVRCLKSRFDLKIHAITAYMYVSAWDILLFHPDSTESSDRKTESHLHLLLKPRMLNIQCLSWEQKHDPYTYRRVTSCASFKSAQLGVKGDSKASFHFPGQNIHRHN